MVFRGRYGFSGRHRPRGMEEALDRTRNGRTNNNIKGYLNGALVATVTQSNPLALQGTSVLLVGGYMGGVPNNGLMSDFRLYDNKALTSAEVFNLWNANCAST